MKNDIFPYDLKNIHPSIKYLGVTSFLDSFEEEEIDYEDIPKNIYKEGKAFLITESEFQKVQEYKRTHPNLIKERPDLFDSLVLIEQSYYSQKK
jgi:hypothetical protein